MRSETEALLLYLALAQKDCPEEVIMKLTGRVVLPRHHSESCICKGTGKVPLFPDTVRVECKQIHNLFGQEGRSVRGASCSEVGCPGWVPSTDPMVWLVMAEAEGYITGLISDDNGHWAAVGDGMQPVPQADKPGIPWTRFDLENAIWRDTPFEAILGALEVAIELTS